MPCNVEVMIELCRKSATMPCYAHPGDAGMDIYAAEQVIIYPQQTVLIPTGIKFAIPYGYEIQVRPRSGISLNTPLRIPNSPGTIDSGYRDELYIIMTNNSPSACSCNTINDLLKKDELLQINQSGNGSYVINPGDKIAQIFVNPVPKIQLQLVSSVCNIGTNRCGGFGSTGTK